MAQNPTPFEQLQAATFAIPPNFELARTAMAGIGNEVTATEDRATLVASVTDTLGTLVTRMSQVEPAVEPAVLDEFKSHLGVYTTLSNALNQVAQTPDMPTQTQGKSQTGGKS
jgi:hypothetical protein